MALITTVPVPNIWDEICKGNVEPCLTRHSRVQTPTKLQTVAQTVTVVTVELHSSYSTVTLTY